MASNQDPNSSHMLYQQSYNSYQNPTTVNQQSSIGAWNQMSHQQQHTQHQVGMQQQQSVSATPYAIPYHTGDVSSYADKAGYGGSYALQYGGGGDSTADYYNRQQNDYSYSQTQQHPQQTGQWNQQQTTAYQQAYVGQPVYSSYGTTNVSDRDMSRSVGYASSQQQQLPNMTRPPPNMKRDNGGDNTFHGMQTNLSTLDSGVHTAAAYTASWVSSTSSIPPELKDEPEVPSYNGSIHGGTTAPTTGGSVGGSIGGGATSTNSIGWARHIGGNSTTTIGGATTTSSGLWSTPTTPTAYQHHLHTTTSSVAAATTGSTTKSNDLHSGGTGGYSQSVNSFADQFGSMGIHDTNKISDQSVGQWDNKTALTAQQWPGLGTDTEQNANAMKPKKRLDERDRRNREEPRELTWEERLKKATAQKERAEQRGWEGGAVERSDQPLQQRGAGGERLNEISGPMSMDRNRGGRSSASGPRGGSMSGNNISTTTNNRGTGGGLNGGRPNNDRIIRADAQQDGVGGQQMRNWNAIMQRNGNDNRNFNRDHNGAGDGGLMDGRGSMRGRGGPRMPTGPMGGPMGGPPFTGHPPPPMMGWMAPRGGPMMRGGPIPHPPPPMMGMHPPQDQRFKNTWLDANAFPQAFPHPMPFAPMMGPMGAPNFMRGRGRGGIGMRGGRGGHRRFERRDGEKREGGDSPEGGEENKSTGSPSAAPIDGTNEQRHDTDSGTASADATVGTEGKSPSPHGASPVV